MLCSADLVKPGQVEKASSRAKRANALHEPAHMSQGQDLAAVQGVCNGPGRYCSHYGAAIWEDGQQCRLLHVHAIVLVVVGWDPKEHQEVHDTCTSQPY